MLVLLPASPLVDLLDGSHRSDGSDGTAATTAQPLTGPEPSGSTAGVPASLTTPATAELPQLDLPTTEGLTDALREPLAAGALGPGRSVSVVVRDLETGAGLLDDDGSVPRTSASTAKLVTAVSALHHLGPDAVLTTRTVRGAAADEVVLVGGGDPTLTVRGGGPHPGSASLRELARSTAGALLADGTTEVSLVLDDTAFTGSATADGWEAGDLANGTVAPVTALTLDAGRREPGGRLRHVDPTAAAGDEFARLLGRAGVDVRAVDRGRAPSATTTSAATPSAPASPGAPGESGTADEIGPEVLAEVSSPPVSALVERMLLVSDNDVAEALARAAGRAAGTGSDFAGGAAAARQALDALGLDTSGLTLVDGSGLSRQNQVTAALLADVVLAAARPDRPELLPVLSGLPVAGVTGTLANRFDTPGLGPARGVVRGKTGTLTGAHGLVGTVVDADGAVLVVAVLAEDTAPAFADARRALDGVLAALAGCGCRTEPTPDADQGP